MTESNTRNIEIHEENFKRSRKSDVKKLYGILARHFNGAWCASLPGGERR